MFLFSSVASLNCSAVNLDELDSEQLLTDENGDVYGFISENDQPFITSVKEPFFDDLDVASIPWNKFPDYIQTIVYMGLSGLTSSDIYGYQVPFISVISQDSYSYVILVGVNVGYVNSADGSFYRLVTVDGYSGFCYRAVLKKENHEIVTDWQPLTATQWGSKKVYYFSNTNLNATTNTDVYMYGSFGLQYGDVKQVSLMCTDTAYVTTFIQNSGNGTSSMANCGMYNASNFSNLYFAGFTPKTPQQIEDDKEEGLFNKVGQWISNLGDTLLNGLKSLFIPSDSFFTEYFEKLKTFFSDRFGLLYDLPEALVKILQSIIDFEPVEDGHYIHFPGIDVPSISDGQLIWHHLIDEQDYTFDFLNQSPFDSMYSIYRKMCWLTYAFALINLSRKKFSSVFGGD